MSHKVLVIDDDEMVRYNVRACLEDLDYQVETAEHGRRGVELFENEPADVVLTDMTMPVMNGLEVLKTFRKRWPDTPIIVFSGNSCNREVQEIIHHGAWGYLLKPIHNAYELDSVLRCNLERAKLLLKNRQLQIDSENPEENKSQLRAQRVACVGQLTNGVAHDLNNIFAPILTATELLTQENSAQERHDLLQMITESAFRGTDLVRQLLQYSRGVEGNKQLLSVQEPVLEIIRLVSETFPKTITISHDVEKDLWKIYGDPTHIHQILMNLCINARDAMADKGTLKVSIKNSEQKQPFSKNSNATSSGPYIIISIEDTGTGIPDEVMGQIFDSFFSTKAPGKGNGLGLSTVNSIVKGYGGFIQVQTQLGKGSIFQVFLPATLEEAAPLPISNIIEVTRQGDGETILVVDDEPLIRNVTKRYLHRKGYQVLEAESGSEAIELVKTYPDLIHAALVDLHMPEIDGFSLISELRILDPEIKIIATSGIPLDRDYQDELVLQGTIDDFLPKPWASENLLTILNHLLHRNIP